MYLGQNGIMSKVFSVNIEMSQHGITTFRNGKTALCKHGIESKLT